MVSRVSIRSLSGIAQLALLASCMAIPPVIFAQDDGSKAVPAGRPFVVEYYYKVNWGHAEEFITLFEKNHYPLLKKQVEMGRMRSVTAVAPRYHMPEDGRWDYRVTIVFKDAATANDGFDEKALIRQLFPDQTTYQKEEQRRFEILDAHWDLPIKNVNLQ